MDLLTYKLGVFHQNLLLFTGKTGKNAKQMAQEIGVPYTTFMEWYKGRIIPKAGGLQKLADYLQVTPDELTEDWMGRTGKAQVLCTPIPVYAAAAISAGVEEQPPVPDDDGGAIADDIGHIIGKEYIPAQIVGDDSYIALRLGDESMSPRFCAGDIAIVRRQTDQVEYTDNALVAVKLQEQLMCRRLRSYRDEIRLIPGNDAFERIDLSKEEAGQALRILGTVVEVRARF